jgi:hypothetical protein
MRNLRLHDQLNVIDHGWRRRVEAGLNPMILAALEAAKYAPLCDVLECT